jgi:O-antigen ligase
VPLGLFVVGLRVLRRPADLQAFLRVVVVTALITALYMLKQLFFGFDDAERTYWTVRGNTNVIEEQKLFSTAVAPDVYGFMSAFFVLACVAAGSMRLWPRLAIWTAALCSVGVVASGLRIALFGLVLAGSLLLAMLLTDERTRAGAVRLLLVGTAATVLLVALVIVTPAPSDRLLTQAAATPWDAALQKLALFKRGTDDDNYQTRAERVPQFFDYIDEHPWGTGPGVTDLLSFNTFTDVGQQKPNLPDYVIDTPFIFQHDFFYFDVGVELGVIGLAMYVVLLFGGIAIAVHGWRRSQRAPVQHVFLALVASAILLTAIHNLTNVAFRTPQVAGYAWFLLAAPIALLPAGIERQYQAAATSTSVG